MEKVIQHRDINECAVELPGSKSYTHRLLIATALSDGLCHLKNPLKSEDTAYTKAALSAMGIVIEEIENDLIIYGKGGDFNPYDTPIYLGNSGTSMRLLTSVGVLGKGRYIFTGTQRLQQRPIINLIEGLRQIEAEAICVNNCPPIEVTGGTVKGGRMYLRCGVSSQFLSSVLLIAPYLIEGLEIYVVEGPVSKPYVDITVEVMEKMGIHVERDGYNYFKILPGWKYRSGLYDVEPDASQASYFWAAAAITGGTVKATGLKKNSNQGDIKFADVLQKMGCRVEENHSGIEVTGGNLKGITVDMANMPDVVPTLAVVAAFAKGDTVVTGVSHLKEKESNRLMAPVNELRKMGIAAEFSGDTLKVTGGSPKGADIKTYDDHRMAMSFAVAGLRTQGVNILDAECVNKSFPNFWEVFEKLC